MKAEFDAEFQQVLHQHRDIPCTTISVAREAAGRLIFATVYYNWNIFSPYPMQIVKELDTENRGMLTMKQIAVFLGESRNVQIRSADLEREFKVSVTVNSLMFYTI